MKGMFVFMWSFIVIFELTAAIDGLILKRNDHFSSSSKKLQPDGQQIQDDDNVSKVNSKFLTTDLGNGINGYEDEIDYDKNDKEIVWLSPGKRLNNEHLFTPYISVGVLSNLKEFFENLRTNMDTINKDKITEEFLYGDAKPAEQNYDSRNNFIYGQKPSSKTRNYVQSPELGNFKGTNRHDPSFMWSGLGKRAGNDKIKKSSSTIRAWLKR